MGESHISTQILRARTAADTRSAWIAAIAIPLMLLAPALWNGYPLLQWDTGGYLARWYEGYLVPSRSTTFGLYLHFGEDSSFWINLGISALATLWILQLTLRVLGMPQPLRLLAISLVLVLTTSLPWLASTLLTDIFAGLSVLALFILAAHGERTSIPEKCLLFGLTAFAAATHSATLAVLLGLCCIGWIARPFLRGRISVSGLAQGSLTIVAGALLLLSTNFALSGKLAWTPGGYGVAFGRMLQDGIVAQYLRDHCPKQSFKLCPYRDRLPATADQFLWGNSMFNTLGRFQGMNEEMGFIVQHSLAEYPAWQAKAALSGTAQQLLQVATGRHRCLARPYLRHCRALSSRTDKADARGAAAALAFRFHRDQPGSRSRRADVDAAGRDPVRPRRAAPAVRRSHFARGHDHISRARQRVHLCGDIRPA
jgi:hypothetical protein